MQSNRSEGHATGARPLYFALLTLVQLTVARSIDCLVAVSVS